MRSEFFRIVSTLILTILFLLIYSQSTKAQVMQTRAKGHLVKPGNKLSIGS